MRRLFAVLTCVLVAAPLAAQQQPTQQPGDQGTPRRFAPPPDHWMTIDSLSQALGLTADQRTKVTPSYTALNGVLKDAAARRQAIRQQMQASGFTPGQEPTPEQRAKFDSVRAQMQGFQDEADQYGTAIRSSLTPAQQTKFDSLPKPQVMRRGMGGGQPRQ